MGCQWFNLNSILPGPELLSDTYLSLYLAQLQRDNYSIFVVYGDLPDCEADQILKIQPLAPEQFRKQTKQPVRQEDDDDDQLKAVLEMSRKELDEEDEQESLNQAIMLSLQSAQQTTEPVDEKEDLEFIRQRRLMRLGQSSKP